MITKKIVEMYIARDGSQFTSLDEAHNYELKNKFMQTVFMNDNILSNDVAATRFLNNIDAIESFLSSYRSRVVGDHVEQVPTKQEPVETTPSRVTVDILPVLSPVTLSPVTPQDPSNYVFGNAIPTSSLGMKHSKKRRYSTSRVGLKRFAVDPNDPTDLPKSKQQQLYKQGLFHPRVPTFAGVPEEMRLVPHKLADLLGYPRSSLGFVLAGHPGPVNRIRGEMIDLVDEFYASGEHLKYQEFSKKNRPKGRHKGTKNKKTIMSAPAPTTTVVVTPNKSTQTHGTTKPFGPVAENQKLNPNQLTKIMEAFLLCKSGIYDKTADVNLHNYLVKKSFILYSKDTRQWFTTNSGWNLYNRLKEKNFA